MLLSRSFSTRTWPEILLPFAVTRNRDEIDRRIEIDFANQVGKKNARALQHADQMNALRPLKSFVIICATSRTRF